MNEKPSVVFVCYQNAGRSRIAEAYLGALAGDRYEALSAGIAPAEHTHAEAIAVMAEEGITVDDRPGEALTPERAAEALRVITLNCDVSDVTSDAEAWQIPEGDGDKLERARAQRDAIRERITTLIEDLDRQVTSPGQ